jgi:hypothetical protein
MIQTNCDHATSGNLTFEKKISSQMPTQTGRHHSQMPCYRDIPGSGILAKCLYLIQYQRYICLQHYIKYIKPQTQY